MQYCMRRGAREEYDITDTYQKGCADPKLVLAARDTPGRCFSPIAFAVRVDQLAPCVCVCVV